MTRRSTLLIGAALLAQGCSSTTANPNPPRSEARPDAGPEDRPRTRPAPVGEPLTLEQVTVGLPDSFRCERDELARVHCGKVSGGERDRIPEFDGALGLARSHLVVCANVRAERVVCFAPNTGDVATVEGLFEPEFIYSRGPQVCAISKGEVRCFEPERFVSATDQPHYVPGHLKDRPFEIGPAAQIAALVPGTASMHFIDPAGRLCHDVACSAIREEVPPLVDAALVRWEHGCGISRDERVLCWHTGLQKDQFGNPMLATQIDVRDDIAGARAIATGDVDLEEGQRPSACVLTDLQEVWCFGDPGYGSLAPGTVRPGPDRDPAQRVELPPVRRLSSIAGAICADLESGPRHCWGSTRRLRPGSFEE